MNLIEKILLSPITAIYASVIWLRNKAYDKKWFKSVKFDVPVISVGNLTVGGTGKTPHTEYLIRLLKDHFPLAVVSSGYRRRTSGFLEVKPTHTAKDVGDEPLLYKWKYPEVHVGVAEERTIGIPGIIGDTPKVVLLDDAFQHRAVRPGVSILLTDYNHLYTRDYLLPVGKLREFKKGAARADLIVVSKSPKDLDKASRDKIIAELAPLPYQHVFFSHLEYSAIYPLFDRSQIIDSLNTEVLMLTGIANPAPMKTQLETQFKAVYNREFDDHHHYNQDDVESIITTFNNIEASQKVLITTEKDATRLLPFKQDFIKNGIPVFCLPVSVNFAASDKGKFNKAIELYLSKTIEIAPIEENEHHQENKPNS